jgi:multidrug efflux pump subunit AcrB
MTGFNRGFERFRAFYGWLLTGSCGARVLTPAVAARGACAAVLSLFVGRDFFPTVDAGLIQLHVRAPARTRIERTEQIFQAVEDNIRHHPGSDLRLVSTISACPSAPINLAFTDGTAIGVNDGVIQVAAEGRPRADRRLCEAAARGIAGRLPDVQFYFQPADMVTQILNFGVPAQIDVQVQGRDRAKNLEIAQDMQRRISADARHRRRAHLQQELDAPEFYYTIDRTRAQELGLTVQSGGQHNQ